MRDAASPWRAWLPAQLQVDATERWRAALGAGLGILFAALLSRLLSGGGAPAALAPTWLVAPMGASAVLVFAVPASPLAQPWAVVGGNTVSALVGIACALAVPDPSWAAALAVGLAIGAMFTLRCLHPPGGAMALLTAFGGVGSVGFALFPAAINSLLLVAAGLAYNRATGRRYPHGQQVPAAPAAGGASFTDADLDAVLGRYNQVLDLPRDDLAAMLAAAEGEAYRRRLGALTCADIMSRDPVTVSFGTPLQEAWALLHRHRIKALPVVDRAQRVVGIVTLADFLRHADLERHEGWSQRLRAFIRPSGTTHGDKPEVVGQIMTRQVRVASAERPLAELLPLFAQGGHHHIPIVGTEARLVGMLTQSDVVSSLLRSG